MYLLFEGTFLPTWKNKNKQQQRKNTILHIEKVLSKSACHYDVYKTL